MKTTSKNDAVIHDLNEIISDAEALLKSAATPAGDDFKVAKERFEATIRNAKDEILRLEKLVVGKTKEAAKATEEYVSENPWQAVGLAAAVGLVIGLLISRK